MLTSCTLSSFACSCSALWAAASSIASACAALQAYVTRSGLCRRPRDKPRALHKQLMAPLRFIQLQLLLLHPRLQLQRARYSERDI